uniref:Placenta associated 8 n=1 Tax=Pelodiscus sinensis TaxID=13735 RepID=K7GEC4_PELSI
MDPQTVVVLQPQIAVAPASSNAWQTGLLDCCSDFGVCLCGIVCCCFLDCKIADEMGECCCCGSSVAMRTLYRTKYRIPVGYCLIFCFAHAPRPALKAGVRNLFWVKGYWPTEKSVGSCTKVRGKTNKRKTSLTWLPEP